MFDIKSIPGYIYTTWFFCMDGMYTHCSCVESMTKEMNDELLDKALQLGANAIIGYRYDYENISSKGKSLIIVYGQGTAVVIE